MNIKKTSRIVAMLREPSTLAGLSLLLTMAGVPDGVPEAAMNAAAGVLAVLAVVMPEGAGRG